MQQIVDGEVKLRSKMVLMSVNQLYEYLITSGSISVIYMNIFIKFNGMITLRKFQDFIIVNKDNLNRNDYDETWYLLSFIILNLYKHFKANDEYELNDNPFVIFLDKKIVS